MEILRAKADQLRWQTMYAVASCDADTAEGGLLC